MENNKNIILAFVIIGLLAAVGYFLYANSSNTIDNNDIEYEDGETTHSPTSTTSPIVSSTPTPTTSGTTSPAPTKTTQALKTFNVSGNNFAFSLKEIRVKQGDKVKISFKNEVGTHDLVIDEFNARTPKIQSGQSADIEFTADKKGEFEFYCSVGSHRAMGMKGKLIVE